MPRQATQIRDAAPEDADELLGLWALVGNGENSTRAREDAERALANMAAEPDVRMVVAEIEDRIVGSIHLSRSSISPLVLEPAVHTSFLIVLPEYRRHGVAHALLEAAVSWAEEKDIDQVTAITDGNRETNRFFARLGLVTFANVRHSGTGALRKKLSTERSRVTGGSNRHLIEVLAQRRSMRRRQASD